MGCRMGQNAIDTGRHSVIIPDSVILYQTLLYYIRLCYHIRLRYHIRLCYHIGLCYTISDSVILYRTPLCYIGLRYHIGLRYAISDSIIISDSVMTLLYIFFWLCNKIALWITWQSADIIIALRYQTLSSNRHFNQYWSTY